MKKSDLYVAQRQSTFAIIFIVLRFLKKIVMQLWPLFIAAFLGNRGGSSTFDTIEIILSGLGIFGMLSSVIAYFKYYFHISDDELIIEKGVLKKIKLNIPFDRIQSVNFRQTLVHRFLNVTEVSIETAGSAEQETKIDALQIPLANQLRDLILEKKAIQKSTDEGLPVAVESDEKLILALAPKDLFKVGLVQNHLKPLGILIGLIFTVSFSTDTFDFNPWKVYQEIFSRGETLPIKVLIILGVLLLLSFVIFSIVTVFLKNYDLKFSRIRGKFHVIRGLFTREEYNALDNKIQILSWGQNVFEKLIGFYNIQFKQAKSGEEKKGSQTFSIVGCNEQQVEYVKQNWLGERTLNFGKYTSVSRHMFWHFAIYAIPLTLFLSGLNLYLENLLQAAILLLIGTYAIYLQHLNYKKKVYSINEHHLYVGGGSLGFRHSLLPLYKVQNARITESPYQSRRGLSTLLVFTAGGTVRIPYIKKESAIALLDEIIYKTESSSLDFM